MSHVSNCLKMISILNSSGLVKSKDLTSMLEVKERMIRKYKSDIEMAGIQIGAKAGRYGGYYLEKKSAFPEMEFQQHELNALEILKVTYYQNYRLLER
ncbi:helix-turn-helix transcriptional regulator [Bacillus massiliigorillae]|uniref:helix-turn-helix transcriptional regulator n=1 Tax=Bacillus massiliigorillae TaxID=1243664 RepID=UPI0005AA58A5|nr:HTH domain-containing protein [Bacillus massiliigorillae]